MVPMPPLAARLLRALASLRLAIVLLALFAACLAGATLIESLHGAAAAGELVYRTWWFALLLGLLAANVVGAAVKKYPWKRHQTGFLVTHAGLLVLIAGALLTALLGVEGQMVLIDTADPAIHSRVGLSNQSRSIYLADAHRIDVHRIDRRLLADPPALHRYLREALHAEPADEPDERAGRHWALTFRPGPLPWYPAEDDARRPAWGVRLLQRLAAPWPGCALDLDEGATLTVDDFSPHAALAADGEGGFVPRAGSGGPAGQAVRCRLSAKGASRDFWVGLSREAARIRVGDYLYLVRYGQATSPAGFTLTLRRARAVKDPGSSRPAAFESEVAVAVPEAPSEVREQRIVMNQPLSVGWCKVYQANYRALLDPATGEPLRDGARLVSLSGLAVAHDPGLWLKYAGSLLVVLGIVTMFYMKAYFFRPRGRPSSCKEQVHV
jgi:hypothetical protein